MSGSSGLPFIPPQASTAAPAIDLLVLVITLVALFFSVGVVIAIVWLAVKYRRGHQVDRSNPPQYNEPLEIAWTVIPLAMAMGLFVWSTVVFLDQKRMPAGAMEIYLVGKQWMWKWQHPNGRWENNDLHLPLGKPIKLTMTSEDVIHSFFVPAFRLHQDIVPGEYTHTWFTPTQAGRYPLYCAQFCGTLHSQMTGIVTVMEPADYEAWLTAGAGQQDIAAAGQRLFIQHGCNGCHGANSSVRAPRLEGIYGKPVAVQIPKPGTPLEKTPATTVIADHRYIHDAILLPEQEVAAGYAPIMPTFKNRIKESEILQIVAYIRSLSKTRPEPDRGPQRALSAEEYRARTGFVPRNIPGVAGGAAGPPTPSGGNPPVGGTAPVRR